MLLIGTTKIGAAAAVCFGFGLLDAMSTLVRDECCLCRVQVQEIVSEHHRGFWFFLLIFG
jgi:hypothetical protein